MKRALKRVGGLILLVGFGVWLNNTSVLVSGKDQHQTRVIAHRGVHQIYAGSDRSQDSCHAAPVEPITHTFVENTIPSMREAFRLGADVVEIDVHLTRDGVFTVFHDWTLECRTDGTGVTHEHNVEDLRKLDVAYRIDDGSGTYPLRGTGLGLMPTLNEVLADGLAGPLMINFKSRRREEGLAFARLLDETGAQDQVFGVYGGGPPTHAAIKARDGLRGFDRTSLRDCLIRYLAFGWSGFVPKICQNTILLIPQNYAGYLWGWPHRFTQRMSDAGTEVVLVGPYDGSGFTSGIDDDDTLAQVPALFDGFIWTNRIERIGPLVQRGT